MLRMNGGEGKEGESQTEIRIFFVLRQFESMLQNLESFGFIIN